MSVFQEALRPIVDLDVLSVPPTQRAKCLLEYAQVLTALGVAFWNSHEDSDSPETATLLSTRRDHPRGRYTSKQGNDIASSHGGTEKRPADTQPSTFVTSWRAGSCTQSTSEASEAPCLNWVTRLHRRTMDEVCIIPKNGHHANRSPCPVCAKNGPFMLSADKSITQGALASRSMFSRWPLADPSAPKPDCRQQS